MFNENRSILCYFVYFNINFVCCYRIHSSSNIGIQFRSKLTRFSNLRLIAKNLYNERRLRQTDISVRFLHRNIEFYYRSTIPSAITLMHILFFHIYVTLSSPILFYSYQGSRKNVHIKLMVCNKNVCTSVK